MYISNAKILNMGILYLKCDGRIKCDISVFEASFVSAKDDIHDFIQMMRISTMLPIQVFHSSLLIKKSWLKLRRTAN